MIELFMALAGVAIIGLVLCIAGYAVAEWMDF